jgi:hypothetical protein
LNGAAATISKDRPRFALSTEESEDPEKVLEAALLLRPEYEVQTGPCLLAEKKIYTDAVFLK